MGTAKRKLLPAVVTRARGIPAWLGQLRSPYPPGHFHSPIPDLDDVRAREAQIFAVPPSLPGIDLRAEAQLELLPEFEVYAKDMPFGTTTGETRYRLANRWFAHGDGVALYSMLRRLRPKRYVEVGSGWSSALTLDVNELFLDRAVHCTFIEPDPRRLRALLRTGDSVELLERPLHAVPPEVLTDLSPGDVLFIDSSHVSRVGSDVNQLLLDVLPALPAGVHVHVHDIFYPFEYPPRWVYRGRVWTEGYLLRALLTGNPRLRITWFNSYLGQFHREPVAAALPAWAPVPGSSIWLETA